MRKASFSRKVFIGFDVLVMILLMFCCLYPILHVVFASFSDSNALMEHSGLLLQPLKPTWRAYKAVIDNPMILSGYMNTLFVLVVGVIINLFMTTLAAYFLSRRTKILFKNFIMGLMMFTMYFSGGLIPGYILIQDLGLYDTLWSLILPGAISTYNLIIMKTSFQQIPQSLEEAAMLDGANHWQIIWHVVLPLSKAIVAVMVLYYGVSHWNAWFGASIYLQDRSKYPLQLVLKEILIQNDMSNMTQGASTGDSYSVGESIKYAVIVVSTLPILCIYPFLQKYFVKGVMIGAVKG